METTTYPTLDLKIPVPEGVTKQQVAETLNVFLIGRLVYQNEVGPSGWRRFGPRPVNGEESCWELDEVGEWRIRFNDEGTHFQIQFADSKKTHEANLMAKWYDYQMFG